MAGSIAILVLAAMAALCSGFGVWTAGLVVDKACTKRCDLGLGLAGLVAAGGLLNVFDFATRPILIGLLIAGASIGAALSWRRWISDIPRRYWLLAALVAVPVGFAVLTQLRPRVFNYHDDFQKYFVHPVRMLETGSVAGGPLSAVGSETLGGQAFLQGILAAFVPIEYINAVDGVLGFFLCVVLAKRSAVSVLGGVVSIAAVIVINPEYVNISSLYLLAALTMTAVYLGSSRSPSPVALGLVYASMIALKTTAAPFVVAHAIAVIASVRVGRTIAVIRFCGSLVFATLLFVLPWILVHVDSWAGPWTALPAVGPYRNSMDLFSHERLFYGASLVSYTVLVFALVVSAILRVLGGERPWGAREVYLIALGTLSLGLYYIFTFGFGKLYGNWAAVRYFTPFCIGLTPAAIAELNSGRRWPAYVALATVGAGLIAFIPDCTTRLFRAYRAGSALSFAAAGESDYRKYSEYVLSDQARSLIIAAQRRIPPGEPVLVWLDFPFYLDFARNPVFDIDTAGLATPWARLPDVRYVIWARRGYASLSRSYFERRQFGPGLRERLIAVRTLRAIETLGALTERGVLLWESGGVSVYDLCAQKPSGSSAEP